MILNLSQVMILSENLKDLVQCLLKKSQEGNGQHEEVCSMSPKNGTSIYLTVTSESDEM